MSIQSYFQIYSTNHLLDFLSSSCSKKTTIDSEILTSAHNGRFSSNKAIEINTIASESFDIKLTLNSFSSEIKQPIEQIKFIEKQIFDLKNRYKHFLKS